MKEYYQSMQTIIRRYLCKNIYNIYLNKICLSILLFYKCQQIILVMTTKSQQLHI